MGLRPVTPVYKSLADYAQIVGEDAVVEIEALAKPLRGARILHVSASAFGGGVAEMLHTLVPLMRSVGLHAEWRVISGSNAFFNVMKSMRSALDGTDVELTRAMQANYLITNLQNAAHFEDRFDFVVVHDHPPAPLRSLRMTAGGTWIWHCHVGLADAQPVYWQHLRSFVEQYDAAIFAMPSFAKADLRIGRVALIPPTVDPLSPRNAPLSVDQVTTVVALAGVDPSRPTVLQVSRFDPQKDPLGVIDAFRAVRAEMPELQLVLLGTMAHDDPDGMLCYQRTVTHAGNDPDIHLLTNAGGSAEVNAFQRHAAAIVQKSLREDFGLTVTEGLWKARPVIGSNVGGIPLQIEDGKSGYLVESTYGCVIRLLAVLREPQLGAELGRRGREVVRRNFLSTANLRQYLQLFNDLAHGGAAAGQLPRADVHRPDWP
jgi:trehalose synthase